MTEITQTLARLFESKRIIFWYDTKQELQAEFEAVNLPGVEKIVLGNNQFGLKYRMLQERPNQKFLLYHHGPQPNDLENWLLDVQLAHGEFRADQTALWLHELGLGLEFTEVIAPHAYFFKTANQRIKLKSLLKNDDTPNQILLKMVAVCAAAEPRLDAILESLLAELAAEKDKKLRQIQQCDLESFLWQQAELAYGYKSDASSIRDFAISLFKSAYAQGLEESSQLTTEATVFLKRWKDSVNYRPAFATLSSEFAKILNIQTDLEQREYQQLLDLDYFELIDRKILSDLVREVVNRTISRDTCAQLVRRRRQSCWYDQYRHLYEAIDVAARFLQHLDQVTLTISSFADGVAQYSRTWFALDQQYRQFIYHARQAGRMTILTDLINEVDNRYTNSYLLPLNDRWQSSVDVIEDWASVAQPRQADFFNTYIDPFLRKDNKVFVIISDALRYEAGAELADLIRQEDRYEATLEPMITALPSFTQLGMAALLPHDSLSLAPDGKTIHVSGQRSAGIEPRKKILEQKLNGQGTAMQADAFLNMGREESRALFRNHKVVYLYHNRIDAVGDDSKSEERTVDAVADALKEIILIIKRLAAANVSNMLITADHGFIYQHRSLDESDFSSQDPSGETILVKNRRFVLGHGLRDDASFKHFTSAQIGLDGEMEMLIPKSINRLRVRGAGSRYVHGGASLQEIVVPVIQVNKKRQSDVTKVGVDILRGANTVITTNQFTVRFYQTEPTTAKVQPRTLRIGLYTRANDLISDRHEILFDLPSENEREREIPVQFILTRQADEANGQEVILKLEEPIQDTSHYQDYKTARYTLRRSFTSDFVDF